MMSNHGKLDNSGNARVFDNVESSRRNFLKTAIGGAAVTSGESCRMFHTVSRECWDQESEPLPGAAPDLCGCLMMERRDDGLCCPSP